jgi:hypothetical protein
LPEEAAARETAKVFVRDRVDLIVAFESQCVRAAKAAQATAADRPLPRMSPRLLRGLVRGRAPL